MKPERVRLGSARGLRFGARDERLEHSALRWIAARDVEEGEVLRAGRVWRVGAWAVKLGPPRRWPGGWLRAAPALRAARAHLRLLPLRTPRPLLALQWRRSGALAGDLLVSEFIAGGSLLQLWGRDARASAALPACLAGLHARRVLHGDLHPENLIWDGREWVLIDLESLRGGLHGLLRARSFERQWARLLRNLRFDPGLQAAWLEFARLTRAQGDLQRAWARIEERARSLPPVPEPASSGPLAPPGAKA